MSAKSTTALAEKKGEHRSRVFSSSAACKCVVAFHLSRLGLCGNSHMESDFLDLQHGESNVSREVVA